MALSIPRFTTQSFTGALARQPDNTERAAWLAALNAKVDTPARLLTEAQSKVGGLFESSEYVARGRTDEEYVSDLYLGFFAHVSDPTGQTFWESQVAATSRAAVLGNFKNSDEFRARAASLYKEPSADVPAFPSTRYGGPQPARIRPAPPDFQPLHYTHTFEDKSISVGSTGDVPIYAWEISYSGLFPWEAQILDDHYEAARHEEFPFVFVDREGRAWDGVRYSSYEASHEQVWMQERTVKLIRYPN